MDWQLKLWLLQEPVEFEEEGQLKLWNYLGLAVQRAKG